MEIQSCKIVQESNGSNGDRETLQGICDPILLRLLLKTVCTPFLSTNQGYFFQIMPDRNHVHNNYMVEKPRLFQLPNSAVFDIPDLKS